MYNMYSSHRILSTLLGLALCACSSEDDLVEERIAENPEVNVVLTGTPGTANFSKYVAIGNSLTAGLMDAALYNSGQQASFPNILAQQFQIEGVGGGAFNQPDINAERGFNTSLNDLSQPSVATFGHFVLNLNTRSVEPLPNGDPFTSFDGDRSALNNFGVPGARAIDAVTPGYAQFNPFFGRFASNAGTSMLQDAVRAQGTFFTLWLGSNDALAWALAGGSTPDGEENPAAELVESATLTSIGSFTSAYQALVRGLLSVPDAKGVAISLPPVTLLPYFRAVAYNPIPLDEATATALNGAYATYNQGLGAAVALNLITQEEAALRTISFADTTANAVVMLDKDLMPLDISAARGEDPGTTVLPNIRQTNASDLLTLPIGGLLGEEQTTGAGPYGLQDPATDQYVLTLNEQRTLLIRLGTFNAIIEGIVAGAGERIALLDIGPLFADIAGLESAQAEQLGLSAGGQADGSIGLLRDGVSLQPDFSPNGIFSTDGVHPNPKGHAIVADEVVRVINESFGATIPAIDTSPYRTVLTPPL